MIMKNVVKLLAAFMAIGTLFSCEPQEDRDSLPAVSLKPADINIDVTANGNLVTMTNATEDVIPYWTYTDATGNELGHSNENQTQATFPFAGKYTVYFTAFTRGGRVDAAPVVVDIKENDENYFNAPEWALLTNGVAGKTWVLDMVSPVGWAGLDYPAASGDNWNWFPDYAGNEWVMADKDWGKMSFDLNGGYNTSVTQTALTTDDQTTKTGTYSYDIANSSISFNGGVEVLYGGDYHPDVSNWTKVKVVELTETSLRLAVIRDQSRTGEGKCLIVFHYRPQ
jgi:hypothetical protein